MPRPHVLRVFLQRGNLSVVTGGFPQLRLFDFVRIVIYCFALSDVAYVQVVFFTCVRQSTMISQQWPSHHPFYDHVGHCPVA